MQSIRIDINSRTALLIDEHEGNVWLHMYIANGSLYVILTREQAQALIAALQEVVE